MNRFVLGLCTAVMCAQAPAIGQTIASFSPSSGNVGTPVTISGSSLSAVTAVSVNGTSCPIINQSAGSLSFMVMPGATTGTISVTGAATATSASSFTVSNTTITPTQQGSKIVGSGLTSATFFGTLIAFSADGNTMAVGGPSDNSNLGATWIFTRGGTSWTQQAKLVGTGNAGNSQQGTSVALSADGNTLAVGGYSDNSSTGATWIFTRSGSTWTQQGSKLAGTGATANAQQGGYVALSADGNTLASSARNDSSGIGATWVYTRSGGAWTQQGNKLVGTSYVGASTQGNCISLSADGNTLAVGGGSDDNFVGAGWIFTRSGSTWSQLGSKIVGTGYTGSTPYQYSAALSADGLTMALGGTGDNVDIGATWVFSSVSAPVVAALPVKLLSFGAQRSGSVVNTSWQLGNVHNLAKVAVERSADGQQFTELSGVPLFISSYKDEAPLPSASFYRLRIEEKDGTVSYSAVATVAAFGKTATASFFPNPATDKITISGGAEAGTVRVMEGNGRVVFSSDYKSGESVDISKLAAGLYWIQLNDQTATPLVKQ